MNSKLPKHTYSRPRAAEHSDVTSLLYSICNFDFVVAIVIVQMCLAFPQILDFSISMSSGSYIHLKLLSKHW
jgi:hypothetical protein